jgi:hypothetical protein
MFQFRVLIQIKKKYFNANAQFIVFVNLLIFYYFVVILIKKKEYFIQKIEIRPKHKIKFYVYI